MSQQIRALRKLGEEFERVVDPRADADSLPARSTAAHDTGRPVRAGRPRTRGGVALLLSAVVAIAIAAGAVILLGARSHPSSHAPAARTAVHSPQQRLIQILAVLRRPQTNADLDPTLIRRLDQELRLGLGVLRGQPVLSGMRLATITPGGQKVFLVPFRPLSREAIRRYLAMHPKFSGKFDVRAKWPNTETLGLFAGGGGCCATAAMIEAGHDWISSGPIPSEVIFVVPDGVAKVTFGLRHPITVSVHHNIAAFEAPQAIENPTGYPITWYAPSGHVLKRLG